MNINVFEVPSMILGILLSLSIFIMQITKMDMMDMFTDTTVKIGPKFKANSSNLGKLVRATVGRIW